MPDTTHATGFLEVSGHRIHHRFIDGDPDHEPLVFLHEGLGSVELWRRFPDRVAAATGHPALVYSRAGNGWSDRIELPRHPDYMHREALETLPVVVTELVNGPPILIGHSDGASIAIVYAGAGHPVAGMVLIAPHVFVEDETIAAIAAISASFAESDLPEKMAKYHTDPRATFRGWADAWLLPEFRDWNIEEFLEGICCPVLVVQGDRDEYGTLAQLDAIASQVAGSVERLVVPGAGHAPHLSHPEPVTEVVVEFIRSVGGGPG